MLKPRIKITADVTDIILNRFRDDIFRRLEEDVYDLPQKQFAGEDYVKMEDVSRMVDNIIDHYANTKFRK